MRLAFVVQRYGKEVVGGAETLCRDFANRLSPMGFNIDVYTTTAKDYQSWEPFYPAGETILKGVLIKRFDVEKTRNIEDFNRKSQVFFNNFESRSLKEEEGWIVEQGPYVPNLIQELEKSQENYDIVIFFTYLYYTTIEGMKRIKVKKMLFSTAHDELPIRLKTMKNLFTQPDALLFLTKAEETFVKNNFKIKKSLLLRTGLEAELSNSDRDFRAKYGLYVPYFLYAGRIEAGKGLERVFEAYVELGKKRFADLVLIGKKLMDIPSYKGIRYLGYVSNKEKLAAFRGALASIQPSPYESLSITTLESFSQKIPIVANGHCAVLKEHVELSKGGEVFYDSHSLMEGLDKFYLDRRLAIKKGINGYNYLKENFSWEDVLNKFSAFIKDNNFGN